MKKNNYLNLLNLFSLITILVVGVVFISTKKFFAELAQWELVFLILLLFSALISLLVTQFLMPHRTKRLPESPTTKSTEPEDIENIEKRDVKNGVTEKKEETITQIVKHNIAQSLHLINPLSPLRSQLFYALSIFLENCPNSIPVVFTYKDGAIKYLAGARTNSDGLPVFLHDQDPLIEELHQKITQHVNLNNFASEVIHPILLPDPNIEKQCLLAPIEHATSLVGVFSVISLNDGPPGFELRSLSAMYCKSIFIMIDNYNLFYSKEIVKNELAEEIFVQTAFTKHLTDDYGQIDNYKVVHVYEPAFENTGDFHFLMRKNHKEVCIFIGTISGRGMKAALFLSKLKAMARCLIADSSSPADLLNSLSFYLSCDEDEFFTTLLILQLEVDTSEVLFSLAGHHLPLVNRPRSGFVEVPQYENTIPIGFFKQGMPPYSNGTIHLLPGDGILLYTDGVLELSRGNLDITDQERLRLFVDKLPEYSADVFLDSLINRLCPAKTNARTEVDYTAIYVKME